jgi:hypothetical protein
MIGYEVNCIQKAGIDATHEHITHIGHVGDQWRITTECAIARIETHTEVFYTEDQDTGERNYIAVVRETGKAPYLRAYANGDWTDRLLAQPDCNADCSIVWRTRCPRLPRLHRSCACPTARSSIVQFLARSTRLRWFRRS